MEVFAGSVEIPVNGLPANGSTWVPWNFPDGLDAGDHYFYAYLDWYNQVQEGTKTNNGDSLGMIID